VVELYSIRPNGRRVPVKQTGNRFFRWCNGQGRYFPIARAEVIFG
jgi:hypothetical protein